MGSQATIDALKAEHRRSTAANWRKGGIVTEERRDFEIPIQPAFPPPPPPDEELSGFGGSVDNIIAIAATEAGFGSDECGTWERAG
jgi:hypothetical protein